MTVPLLQTAFVTGELSPSLYGRVDIDRQRIAGSTLRNMIVDYRGAALSRAGTKFVAFSKQTGRDFPPRMIGFQFSINQGLALEFGNFYMRVTSKGGLVTEPPVTITNVTQANPAVMTFSANGAQSAVPIDTAVTVSYAPGDLVTLAGGVPITKAVLHVDASQLVSILPNVRGSGYAIADTITLDGGSHTISAVLTVASVAAVAATGFIVFSANPVDASTITLNGVTWTFRTTPTTTAETQIQATLAGTLAQLVIDLNASVNASLTVATYSTDGTSLIVTYDTPGTGGNAYTLAAGGTSNGIVSSGTLTGGATNGVATFTISNVGRYTALPDGGVMTQAATSGGGTGATFQTAVFGPRSVSIAVPGAYTTLPANPVSQDSTTDIGQGATFTVTWGGVSPFVDGDDVFIAGVEGMTELNGNTYTLGSVSPTTAVLIDPYGVPLDSTGFGAYTGGGTASRIYTVPTIYAEEDLKYLKVVQSADVMTICCVNQDTGTEYPPQDLTRFSNTDWQFSDVISVDTVSPPSKTKATISSSGSTYYQYVVTAISPIDGSESIASVIAAVQGVAISTTAGMVTIKWSAVHGVSEYNIYKALPSLGSAVPAGALFGYIGSAYGAEFHDTNIVPTFAQVPPRHINPFARGAVLAVDIVSGGSGYTTATATITTSTGAGAVLDVVVQSGAVVAVVIEDAGHDYDPSDTIHITGSGGSGATATLVVGAETGTYPSVPSYFQQRRFYANSFNQPDTYWASQPGAYTNFDARIPPVDSDALSGSPWGVQVNGIQFMVQTAAGLVLFNGLSAWLLNGTGGFATNSGPITPSSQDANPQPFTGCSPTVRPIKVNNEIIYVTAVASRYYELPYQLNLSEPIDLTRYSAHLFDNHSIVDHDWCEQPNKVMWSVRDDGVMLSLTFLKDEQIAGWGRHDTNGLFSSVCQVIEPPINALYLATKRFINGNEAYMIERMDDRLWQEIEEAWCVDCALRLDMPSPSATLTSDSATGLGAITGVTDLIGGTGYSSSTTVLIFDELGQGSGAAGTVTVNASGKITAVNITSPGSGYLYPKVQFQDPANTGTDAEATAVLSNAAIFTASGAVFAADQVGDVIRMGGGVATIVSFIDTENVGVEITSPITSLRSNSGGAVLPQAPGEWTQTTPITTVGGLGHLAGIEVTGLADGVVIAPQVVNSHGRIVLDRPATAITIGLSFTAQLQSVYVEHHTYGTPTVQGQRKKVGGVSILLEASRDIVAGTNQPDGSAMNPPQIAPEWSGLDSYDNLLRAPYNSRTVPLYTGSVRTTLKGGYQKPGQVAVEQALPVPLNVLNLVPEVDFGDVAEQDQSQQ